MPDRLETRLITERDGLVIDQPPLSDITRRARGLRRRHAVARISAVIAVVLLAVAAGAGILTDRRSPGPPAITPAASITPQGGVWTSNGITVHGLPTAPVDVPGKVVDVEFIDADRGYLLSADCTNPRACTSHFAATLDGGRTWTLPATVTSFGPSPHDRLPRLMAFGAQVAIVGQPTQASAVRRSSLDGGRQWIDAIGSWSPEAAPLPGDARLQLLPGGGVDGCGGQVGAWLPVRDGGGLGLVKALGQPDLAACWVAPVRAGDGAWWVGGRQGDRPAVAVSRDAGATWTTTPFQTSTGDGARVVMFGHDVYAVLVEGGASGAERVTGVAHSSDGGRTFGPPGPPGPPLAGDPVPLLDGRLLLVDAEGRWQISVDRGRSWQRADGLHQTERLARTSAGYIAYGMTDIYTAYSADGVTWQKLNAT